MSEKMSEVFREYDMNILQNMRGRGAVILKTDKGIRQIKSLNESEARLKAEYEFKEAVFDKGFEKIDRCIMNINDNLITYDRYQNPYVMRNYFEGREINISSETDIKDAVKNLALFHKAAKSVYEENKSAVHLRDAGNFAKKNIELKRVRNFIQKNQKRDFELTYLSKFDYFYENAIACEEFYNEKLRDYSDCSHIGYCHGSYDYHSILKEQTELATINFDKFYAGNQIYDLYHFLRKILEKNKYNFNFIVLIIEEYNKHIQIDENDLIYIFILISYPEKFYKLSNQYMNSSKNWIPPKLYEKLNKVIMDEDRKKDTIFQFMSYYSLHI